MGNKYYPVEYNESAINASNEDLKLPSIHDKNVESKLDKHKFHDVPLEISTKIVRSNLREWGSPP